jgi:O-antigen/teichoic acid export membrane protein
VSIHKHTVYNLIGAILPIGLSLVTIPIYIGLIGDGRYGVLAVAWLLLGYFGLFDLGLGRAMAQRIAALRDSPPQDRSTSVWTALAINISLGVAGGLIIWPVAAYFFGHIFSLESALRPELEAAYPWLILAVPLATLSGVLTGALEGRLKFLELNIISVSTSVLVQLLPLAVAWMHGPDLAWLLPSVILARLVTLTLLFARCHVHVLQGFQPTISMTQTKGLLQFGGWVTVTSMVGPMMVILDRFVIGATLGAKAVTYYTVPFQLAERFTILPGALGTALFPRLAAAGSAEAKQLATIAIQSLAVVMTPLMLAGLMLVEPFLQWWLSPDLALRAGLTAKILLLGFWINAFAHIPYAQLQAAGKPDVVAKCHLVELLPYLLLLYVALRYWGLPGAAVVFTLRTLADCMLLLWFSDTFRIGILLLKIPVFLLLSGLAVTLPLSAGGATSWGASLGVLLLSLVWSWQNAPYEVRSLVNRTLGRISVSK